MLEGVKDRRPWPAALITLFLTPAVGMAYLNRGRLALGYFGVLMLLLVAAAILLPQTYPPSRLLLWINIASLVVTILAVIQAIGIARRRDPSEPLKGYARHWYRLAAVYLGIVLILIVVRTFFYRPFDIPASSMEPTANPGDFLLVARRAYDGSPPARGDVIVFYSQQYRSYFIKRIIGVPGDRVQMINSHLVLNGAALLVRRIADFDRACDLDPSCRAPTYVERYPGGKVGKIIDATPNGPLDNTEPFNVPAGSYFVMGDNRDNSNDSRDSIGFVPRDAIIGKAAVKYIADGHWVWRTVD